MNVSDHIKEIEHVAVGKNTGRDAVVLEP